MTNVFHVRAVGMTVADDEQRLELLDDLISAFDGSNFYNGMINDAEMNLGRLLMSNGTTLFPSEQTITTLVGADTGEKVDGASACVVSWRGAWHYRGGKPRTYIPALSDEWFFTPFKLEDTRIAAQRTAALALIAAVEALTGSYGSAVELGALIGNTDAAAGTFYPFTSALVTHQIGHIRRRSAF